MEGSGLRQRLEISSLVAALRSWMGRPSPLESVGGPSGRGLSLSGCGLFFSVGIFVGLACILMGVAFILVGVACLLMGMVCILVGVACILVGSGYSLFVDGYGLYIGGCGLHPSGCGLYFDGCGLYVGGCGLYIGGCGLLHFTFSAQVTAYDNLGVSPSLSCGTYVVLVVLNDFQRIRVLFDCGVDTIVSAEDKIVE